MLLALGWLAIESHEGHFGILQLEVSLSDFTLLNLFLFEVLLFPDVDSFVRFNCRRLGTSFVVCKDHFIATYLGWSFFIVAPCSRARRLFLRHNFGPFLLYWGRFCFSKHSLKIREVILILNINLFPLLTTKK